MKKILIGLIVITIVFVSNDLQKEEVIIPKNSIRFRIIANSDSKVDQQIKKKVKEDLTSNIKMLITDSQNIDDTRKKIKNNLPLIEETINKTLKANSYNNNIEINYGENYFPEKTYKNVVYQAGNYESLVVKIGKGEGQNFWCVLFPPLCFIDEEENNSKVEYHLLVKDILEKFALK